LRVVPCNAYDWVVARLDESGISPRAAFHILSCPIHDSNDPSIAILSVCLVAGNLNEVLELIHSYWRPTDVEIMVELSRMGRSLSPLEAKIASIEAAIAHDEYAAGHADHFEN